MLPSFELCSELCQASTQCQSVTFHSNKVCQHFSRTCTHFVDITGAASLTFQSVDEAPVLGWSLVGYSQACNIGGGEVYLGSSSKRTDSLSHCLASCAQQSKCKSITFWGNNFCSHFSTTCDNVHQYDNKPVISFRFHKEASTTSPPKDTAGPIYAIRPGSNTQWAVLHGQECDIRGGEVYLRSSSAVLASLSQCLASCEQESKCRSVSFLDTKFCMHFSTTCVSTKETPNAISMRKSDYGWISVCAGLDKTNQWL